MEQAFIHVNLPKSSIDAIQRLLERAIEWREEQELVEDQSPSPTHVVVAPAPDDASSISYSQSSTES